eukprot:3940257-Rhodomonas_salina.2
MLWPAIAVQSACKRAERHLICTCSSATASSSWSGSTIADHTLSQYRTSRSKGVAPYAISVPHRQDTYSDIAYGSTGHRAGSPLFSTGHGVGSP